MRSLILAAFAAVASAGYTPECNTDEWIAKSASEKMDTLWSKITADTSKGDWHLAGLLVEGMDEVFSSKGDEFPCYWNGCRNKDIHSVGTVAKVKFNSNGAGAGKFTGIFSESADHGLIRLSVAAGEPNPKSKNLKPGMGLKFLRDGVDSANLVAMFSVDGQPSFNFFENDWNTIIPTAGVALLPVALKFYTATAWIQVCGLSDMASHTQDGTAADTPVFPFRLRFEPSGQVEFPSDTYEDYRVQLSTIQAGTTLFKVHAMDAPEELGGQEIYIGDIVTDSEMTTSNFGDEHLFFRHQKADDDIKLKPEWEQYYPKFSPLLDEEFFEYLANDVDEPSCPFAAMRKYFAQ